MNCCEQLKRLSYDHQVLTQKKKNQERELVMMQSQLEASLRETEQLKRTVNILQTQINLPTDKQKRGSDVMPADQQKIKFRKW